MKWQRNRGIGYNSKLFCTLSFVKASLCRRKAGEKEKKKARWARWAVEPLGGDKSHSMTIADYDSLARATYLPWHEIFAD